MNTPVGMGPGAEFDLIRTLLGVWKEQAVGVGDDSAEVSVPAGERLVVSTDTSVEGVHFRPEWLTPHEIGYRATAAALSDLAACAARPLGVLLALSLPETWVREVAQIAAGVGEAARAAGALIVGGDVTRARDLTLGVTVLGSAVHPLSRTGARAGDTLYVTGELGGPAAAVRAWTRAAEGAGRSPGTSAGKGAARSADTPAPHHRARFAHPVPRVAEARWLAEHGAHAMMDISDGLAGDASHLAAASGVSVVIELERVPVVQGVSSEEAAESGEEYELLLAAPGTLDAREFGQRFGLGLTAVGRVEDGAPDVVLLRDGERVAARGGYQHFTS